MTVGRPYLVLFALAVAVCCVVVAQETSNVPAAGVVAQYQSAYNSKDLEKLNALYASDAIMVSETGIAEGHDAIQSRLSAGVQKGNTIAELHPVRGESSGTLSFTEGSADITNGDQHFRRRYLVVVRTTGSRKEIILHYSLPISDKNPAH